VNGSFTETYAYTQRRDDTWAGAAVGWQATPRLRLGAMLQGAYVTDVWTIDLNSSLQTDSADPLQQGGHVIYSERGDQAYLALRTLLGVQWQASEEVRLAAAVRGPSVRVVAWGPLSKFLSSAVLLPGVPPGQSHQAIEERPSGGLKVVEPVRVYGGLRWARDGWSVALEGDWQPALEGLLASFNEAWNARLGVIWRVDQDLRIGAGIFHDAASASASAGASAMTYTGLTGGVIYRPAAVVKVLSGGNDWDLLTAVAVRGAYGEGTYRGIAITPVDPSGAAVTQFDAQSLTFPDSPARVLEGSISFLTAIIF
jgi:hypothetical protein